MGGIGGWDCSNGGSKFGPSDSTCTLCKLPDLNECTKDSDCEVFKDGKCKSDVLGKMCSYPSIK